MQTSKKLYHLNKHLQLFGLSTGKYLVYGIVSVDTKHTYIGVTTTKRYKKRITEHRTKLLREVHCNKLLQRLYNNGTLASYIIAQTDSKQLADAIEQFCITHFREYLGNSLNLQDNRQGRELLDVPETTNNKAILKLISKTI